MSAKEIAKNVLLTFATHNAGRLLTSRKIREELLDMMELDVNDIAAILTEEGKTTMWDENSERLVWIL